MRNLKKVLSLTLALVMMLGMMTFAGAAETTKKVTTSADLTDMDKVVNKEAVSLLVDLKIVAGRETGAYDPAGTLKRGEFAKMICVTKLGSDKGANLAGGASPLTDIKGHWAEGYIKYCYSTKIVAGTSPTTFSPEGELKVVEAAKMLLTALGYDAELSKYNNDPFWNSNIMTDAQVAGLMDGISQISDEKITRDNAAQMILNALFANQVKPEIDRDMGKIYLAGYVNKYPSKNLLGEFVFGLAKVTGVVTAVDGNGKATISNTTPATFTSTVTNLNGRFAVTPAMIGSKVSVYVKGTINADGTKIAASSVYSSVLTANSSNVLATNYGYKTPGTGALTALLVTADTKVASYDTGVNNDNVVVYYNGARDDAKVAKVGVKGVVTEFKDTNANGGVDTIVITDKKVSTVISAPIMGKDSKGNDVVTFTTLGLAKVDASNVVGYEGLVKDDVILSVTIGGVTYIEKAASVNGVVAGLHSAKGLLLDGTYYNESALVGKSFTTTGWTDFDNTYTFYLDNGKNIVAMTKDTNKTTSSYAVLTDIAWIPGANIGSSNYVEAKLAFTDGTTQIVKIASVDGFKPVPRNTNIDELVSGASFYFTGTKANAVDKTKCTNAISGGTGATTANDFVAFAKASGGDSFARFFIVNSVGTAADAATSMGNFATKGRFYSFTVNADGTYALKDKSGTDKLATTDATIEAKTIKVASTATTYGNAATVFIYATKDSTGTVTYKSYTGIANVPKATGVNQLAGTTVANENNFAKFVYVATTSDKVVGSFDKDIVYITSNDYTTKTVKGASCVEQSAIVNGVAKNITLNTNATVGMYLVSAMDANGIYTLTSTLTGELVKKTGVFSNANGALTTTGDAYSYTDDTQVYLIGTDGSVTTITGAAITLSASDVLYIKADATITTQANVIYVEQTDATAPTAVTIKAGTHTATFATDADLKTGGTAAIDSWTAATADQFKVAATPATGYTVKSITIGAQAEAFTGTGEKTTADYTIKAEGTLQVKVAVADDYSGTISVFDYTITVPAVTAP